MVKQKSLRQSLCTILLALSILVSAPQAHAECVPGAADPCAPKKKIGDWDTSVALGFNMTSGNSDTSLFTFIGSANYEKDSDIFTSQMMYNFGTDKNANSEENDDTVRNDFRAMAQYDYLLTERTYIGFGSKFFYDEIAEIDYRIFADPTAGYYLLKDNSFKFALEGGPSYVFERVGGLNDNYLAPRIGDRFEWMITCTSKIFQQAEILLDVNDSSNYIVNAQLGAEAALSTTMSLVFLIRETYDNQPAAGLDKRDLALISALKFSI
jgi:putative salt-induced outer membrane protein YdiY